MILVIDLVFFALFNAYPEAFQRFLTDNLGYEALGLSIVGGFITSIVASVVLALLFYREMETLLARSLKS